MLRVPGAAQTLASSSEIVQCNGRQQQVEVEVKGGRRRVQAQMQRELDHRELGVPASD